MQLPALSAGTARQRTGGSLMPKLALVSAVLLAAFVTVTVLLFSCSGDGLAGGSSETGNSGVGVLRVETFDAPPPRDVEHVYLTFTMVEIHSEERGWVVVSTDTIQVDFLTLVNGRVAQIVDTPVAVGDYDELRVSLVDTNWIVVAGETYPLTVPSGPTSGVRIHAMFTIAEDRSTLLYVDFDVSASIAPHDSGFRMVPSFNAYDATICGRVTGSVRDSVGTPIAHAVVRTVGAASTHATLSDIDGAYTLILPSGTYTFECAADDLGRADTVHHGVTVSSGETTSELNFIVGR
ncbi:MAG: DUF4382 domain-containing protein [Chitinivibrionales bacterium]|nr:DUF4382 domain-containing protein [Chitinivibrionales bacterium]